jgi:hypothetical protein
MARMVRGWLHAMLAASPEGDEAEAQKYWRARLSDHPEEIREGTRSWRATADRAAESPRRRSWRRWFWFRLFITACFGATTLVLASIGASADKIWYSVALTLVWSLGTTLVWLRYARS